jgi:hypothetical protein
MKTIQHLFLVLLFLSPTFNLSACFDIPANPPDFTFEPEDDYYYYSSAKLTLLNYTTYGADTVNNCACALNMPFQFGFVTGAQVIEVSTGLPLPGFSFSFNFNTTDSLNTLYDANFYDISWNGFASEVTNVIDSGVEVNLCFFIETGKIATENVWDPTLDFLINADVAVVTTGADEEGMPETEGAPNDHFAGLPLGDNLLPVLLTDFFARQNENENVLRWTTQMEIEHDRFEIQKSANGRDFESFKSFANPFGMSFQIKNYEAKDQNPFAKTYYRLKIVDLLGNIEYSKVISLENESLQSMPLSYFPNPTIDKITVRKGSEIDYVKIMSIDGKLIKFQKSPASEYVIDVKDLNPGIYIVYVESLGVIEKFKMIKS